MSRQIQSYRPEQIPSHRQPHFGFVDADNILLSFKNRLTQLGFSEDQFTWFDPTKLFNIMEQERTYVFSAAKNASDTPKWLEGCRSNSGTILRIGTLVEKEGRSRKQEGVDVHLAVEAMKLAYTSRMKTCTIYGADGDFLPLIKALVDYGCITNIVSFNNPSKGRVAPELQAASDKYIKFNNADLLKSYLPEKGTFATSPDFQHRMHRAEKVSKIFEHDFEIFKLDDNFYSIGDRAINTYSSTSQRDIEIHMMLSFWGDERPI